MERDANPEKGTVVLSTSLKASELLAQRTGIFLSAERHDHWQYCLQAACRDTAFTDQAAFLAVLNRSPLTHPVWQRLLHHLAIGETYFFRDAELLRDQVLPSLIASRRADKSHTLRIWSAGCATGEEPYTIALLLHELLPDIAHWNIAIVGTDINQQALAYARRGRYGAWSVRKPPPPASLLYLFRDLERWQLADAIRKMVTFQAHNLVDGVPAMSSADLIVCRNVLLYMTPDLRSQVIGMLKAALAPNGELVLSDIALARHDRDSVNAPNTLNTVNNGDSRKLADLPLRRLIAPRPLDVTDEVAGPTEPIDMARKAADHGNWDEAHSLLDRAEALNRLDLPVYFLRALVYEGQGQFADAIQALRRCLYLDHNFALAHYALGNLHARRGERDQAEQYWANALDLLEDQPEQQALPLADGLTVDDLRALIHSQVAEMAS